MAVGKYPFKGRYEGSNFTLEDVITSLSAQRLLIKQAVSVLEELDPDFTPEKVVVRVVSIEEGSLLWDLIIEIWGVSQDEITGIVTPKIEGALGVDIPEAYEPLVALATVAVIFWGLNYAYDRVKRSRERQKPETPAVPSIHIEGNYNAVVQLFADRTDTSTARVERALDEALFKDRAKVAKAAADFVRPAKRHGGDISILGAPNISREVVSEVPSDEELRKAAEPANLRLKDAMLHIRGTDRDSLQNGWRAFIDSDERFPRRLPLRLDSGIDPEDLANYTHVQADVTVEGERFFDGSYVPRRILLHSYQPL